MATLQELYSLLLQQSNSVIQDATTAIMEIYEDPSNIDAVVECLANGETKFIKKQAAIGVRQMILKHINEYTESGKTEELKSQILEVLVNEDDKSIRHSIIEICDSLFVDETFSWPELIEFAGTLLGDDSTADQQEVALRIYEVVIPNLSASEIGGFLDLISPIIQLGLESDDEDLIIASADITGLFTITFEAPIPDAVNVCFSKLIEVFHACLSNEAPFTYKIALALSTAANMKSCIDPSYLISVLLEIAADEDIPDSSIFLIFNPMTELISQRFSDISDSVESIATAMMACSSRAYVDGCASEQGDIFVICETLGKMITETDTDALFDAIAQQLSENSAGEIFADVYFLQLYIEFAADTAAKHIPLITEFLLRHAGDDEEHGVLELVFECLHMYVKVVNVGLIDYSSAIIEAGISAIQNEHDPLTKAAFNMLSEVFTTIPRDWSDCSDVLQLIMTIANQCEIDVQERALYCAHAVVFAAGEHVADSAEQLLQIFREAVDVPPETHPSMRTTGLLGIAMLHKAVPELMSSVLGDTLSLLGECLQSDDLSVVNSAITASMIIAECSAEQAAEILPLSLETALQLMDREVPQAEFNEEEEVFEGGEESEEVREIIEAKLNAIDLIRTCTKAKPDLVAPFAEQLPDRLIDLVNAVDAPEISSTACKCLGFVTVAFGLDANEIMAQLWDAFDHPFIETVTELFSIARLFVKRGLDMGQAQIAGIVERAEEAFKHKLECQVDDEQDFELLDKAYKFMAVLAVNQPDFFPKDRFLLMARTAMQKNKTEELVFRCQVLGSFYEAHGADLESIEKGIILQCVFNGCAACDGYLPPYPFVAATMITECDPEAALQNAQTAIEAANEIFGADNEGQTYLQETYAAVSAFLLVVLKHSNGEIDISQLIPGVVGSFPIKDKKIARFAYPALCFCFDNFTALFEPVITELCVALGRFFSLNDIEFKEIGLSPQIIASVANVFRNILQNAEGAQQLVDEQLGTESAVARYKQRLQQYR